MFRIVNNVLIRKYYWLHYEQLYFSNLLSTYISNSFVITTAELNTIFVQIQIQTVPTNCLRCVISEWKYKAFNLPLTEFAAVELKEILKMINPLRIKYNFGT